MAPILISLVHPAFLPSYSFTQSLLSFPQHLPPSSAYLSLDQLSAWYKSSDPLHPALLFATFMSGIVWILGEITGNVSQVDRLWTFLPIIYSAHFTFFPKLSGTGEIHNRMLLVFGLQLLWSARLTTNTYRRGFFNPSSEDYRWEVVRDKIPVWAFKILNLTFISIIQNFLLLAAELPQYLLLTLPGKLNANLTPSDYVLSFIFILILVVEMVADNQQQTFQNFKIRVSKGKSSSSTSLTPVEEGRLTRGFVTEGLWGWSRHPNFACEQSTWYIIYAFTVIPFLPTGYLKMMPKLIGDVRSLNDLWAVIKSVQGSAWNYSIWSPLTMSMLFYSSTDLTERISKGKYPLYKQYQKRVGMFWVPITLLKIVFLGMTGRLFKLNEVVYGPAKRQTDVKRKTQ